MRLKHSLNVTSTLVVHRFAFLANKFSAGVSQRQKNTFVKQEISKKERAKAKSTTKYFGLGGGLR